MRLPRFTSEDRESHYKRLAVEARGEVAVRGDWPIGFPYASSSLSARLFRSTSSEPSQRSTSRLSSSVPRSFDSDPRFVEIPLAYRDRSSSPTSVQPSVVALAIRDIPTATPRRTDLATVEISTGLKIIPP
ncbi:hypothetical protein KM043_004171 [Ampulex compressa]|nr:hypothetical protein KM043_004171 [Ampulex compressa]